MKAYQALLLFVVVGLVVCWIYVQRREISFRWHFGMWPSEMGAGRLVADKLTDVNRELDVSRTAAGKAREKFNRALFRDDLRKYARQIRRANRWSDRIDLQYRQLRDLAIFFGFQKEVKSIGEEPPSYGLRVVNS